jgi:hypothetical protein
MNVFPLVPSPQAAANAAAPTKPKIKRECFTIASQTKSRMQFHPAAAKACQK